MADPPDNPNHLISSFDPSSNQLEENDIDQQQSNNFPLQDVDFELPPTNVDTQEFLYFLGDTEYLRLGNHPSQPSHPSLDHNQDLNLNQDNHQDNHQDDHLELSLSDDLPNIQNLQQSSSPFHTTPNHSSLPITSTSQPSSTHLLPSVSVPLSTSLHHQNPPSTKRPRTKNSSIQQTPKKIAPRAQDTKLSENPPTPISMQTSSRPLDLSTRQPSSIDQSPASAVSPHPSTLHVSNPNQHLSQFSLASSPQPMIPLTNIGASMYPVQTQNRQDNPSIPQQNQLKLSDINQTNTNDKINKRSRSNKQDETDGKQTQQEQPQSKKLRINDNTPSSPTNQHQQEDNQNPQQQQIPVFQPQPQFVSPNVPMMRPDMMMLNYPNMLSNLHMQMISSGRYPPGFISQISPNNPVVAPNFIYPMPSSNSGVGLVPDPSQLRLANPADSSLDLRAQLQAQSQPSQQNISSGGPVSVSDDAAQVQQQTHAKLEPHPVLGSWQLQNIPGHNLATATPITTGGNGGVKEDPNKQNNTNRSLKENPTQASNQTPINRGDQTRPENRPQKKQRLVWTPDLHERFLKAIDSVGLGHAVPKTLVSHMNVDGLTTEHVKSHLQKYRNSLRKEAMEDGKERDKQTDSAGPSSAGGRNSKGSIVADEFGATDDAEGVDKTNSSDGKHVSDLPNQVSGQGKSLKGEPRGISDAVGKKVPDKSTPAKPSFKELDELSPIHERRRRSTSPTIAGMAEANQISLEPTVKVEKLQQLIGEKPSSTNEDVLTKKQSHDSAVPALEQDVSKYEAMEGTTEHLMDTEDENKKGKKDSTIPSVQDAEGVTKSKIENREANKIKIDEEKQNVNQSSPPKNILTSDMEIDQIGSNENETSLEMVKDKIMKLKLLVQKFELQVSTMDRRLQKKPSSRRGNAESGGILFGKKNSKKLPIEADSGVSSGSLAAEASRAIEVEDIEILKDIRVNMQKNIEEVYSSLDTEIDRRHKSPDDDYG